MPEIIEVPDGKRILVCHIKRRRRMKSIRMRMKDATTVELSCAIRVPIFIIRNAILANLEILQKQFLKRSTLILPRLSLADKNKYKTTVLDLVVSRAQSLAPDLFKISQNITIGASRTRWGSCDSKRNLRFHYKLAFLPLGLADYIVAHELCHLVELNHSPKFWHLVGQIIPDSRTRRKELKKYNLE